ncbi:hypothetical protein AAC387_Pa03g1671 [Persea americana]
MGASGVGILFISPQGDLVPHAFTSAKHCSNNIMEYQDIIMGIVDTKNVTLPLQHHKLHGAASYHKQANTASSIKSCQNQTKIARSFKTAKRRVHVKFRAISAPFGLTSLLQQLSRSSLRR